jgi:MoaA/NifB/PqqE/SkfB family radical SAM enzyme
VKRVVLSGGEPRLHPKLQQILSYYRKNVDSVIVVSNGYNLCRQEIAQLIKSGATGLAISLDSINPNESILLRETPFNLHRQIISNLKDIPKHFKDFELGINAVVSHVTANWKSVHDLLEFGYSIGVDYVKFQPIFDDGHVKLNAPHLMLTGADFRNLLRIGALLGTFQHPLTNPLGFWKNVADLAKGRALSPKSCSLGHKHYIALRNKLNICYWLDAVSFGKTTEALDAKNVASVKRKFENYKAKCKVDFHCFCTQELSHVWKNEGSNDFDYSLL